MKEACGVVGIMAPGRAVSHLVYDALVALQHRGQESAGMATWDHEGITVFKDNGLVASVFNEQSLHSLRGDLAIGKCQLDGGSTRVPFGRTRRVRSRPQRKFDQY